MPFGNITKTCTTATGADDDDDCRWMHVHSSPHSDKISDDLWCPDPFSYDDDDDEDDGPCDIPCPLYVYTDSEENALDRE